MRIIYLSNKEKENIIRELEKYIQGIKNILKKKDLIKDEDNIIYLDKKPLCFIYEDKIIPTLHIISSFDVNMKYVKVNKGAIEKILNGADVFRPGIIELSNDIKKGDIVVILSEDDYLLAIGISEYDYEEIIKMEKGKIIKNIHYINDKIFRKTLK